MGLRFLSNSPAFAIARRRRQRQQKSEEDLKKMPSVSDDFILKKQLSPSISSSTSTCSSGSSYCSSAPLETSSCFLERRRVDFVEQPEEIPAQTALEACSDKSDIWYQANELQEFRSETKAICKSYLDMRRLQEEEQAADANAATSGEEVTAATRKRHLATSADYPDDGICRRGLEHRVCRERQRRTFLTRKAILQQQGQKRLAAWSVKCNSWATQLALQQGKLDAAAAAAQEDVTMKL